MSNTIYNKVTINGTTYMDLSQDTVADASHIRQGYVGHLNDGTQVTGTYGGGSNSIVVSDTLDSAGGTIRTITTSDDPIMHQQKTNITPGASSITVVPDTGYDAMTSVQINGDTNLIASNIKSGISIFGVTGSYSGSGSGGGTVTQDQDGYIVLPTTGTGGGSGGNTPSATQHVVHFVFTDSTTTDFNIYYNDALFGTMITSYTPETYSSKTVQTAALDNVTWYTRPTITWETIFNDTVDYFQDDNATYAYCWISALSDVQIPDNSVWRITFDNVEYLCTAAYDSTNQMNVLGNFKYSVGADNGSDAPFSFYQSAYGAWSGGVDGPNVNSSHTVKIERGTVQ